MLLHRQRPNEMSCREDGWSRANALLTEDTRQRRGARGCSITVLLISHGVGKDGVGRIGRAP